MNEMSPESARRGLLLVGHGTDNPAGRDEMLLVAREVSAACEYPVEPCFLELADPNIREGVARLYRRGVRRLSVVPLLLFAAGHAKRDIPRAVEAAVGNFPGLRIGPFAQAFGCHARLLELSAKRFSEAVNGHPSFAADETHLILVGRGSNDEEAIEAMRQFTRLRGEATPVGSSETCFIAMASPSLVEAISSVEQRFRGQSTERPKPAPKLIVVQPHLLFRGGLLAQVAKLTNEAAGRTKNVDWLVTQHLGPDDLLVRTILEIADAARSAETFASD